MHRDCRAPDTLQDRELAAPDYLPTGSSPVAGTKHQGGTFFPDIRIPQTHVADGTQARTLPRMRPIARVRETPDSAPPSSAREIRAASPRAAMYLNSARRASRRESTPTTNSPASRAPSLWSNVAIEGLPRHMPIDVKRAVESFPNTGLSGNSDCRTADYRFPTRAAGNVV